MKYCNNIIYTFVPNSHGWIYNKDFYMIDLYSLCLSVKLIKTHNPEYKIKLYTTKELISFFNDTDYFDYLIDIEELVLLNGIDSSKIKLHTLYKLFVPSNENEPFIHIDHDLFINNGELLRNIKKSVIFAFSENLSDSFYSFYNEVTNEVIKTTNINYFKLPCAYNCSIYGSNNHYIINSFKLVLDFYIKNFEFLNDIDKIDCFLEQYLQVNFILDMIDSNDIHTFDKIIHRAPTKLFTAQDFIESDISHFTYDRYDTKNRTLIIQQLINLDKNICKKIEEYEW